MPCLIEMGLCGLQFNLDCLISRYRLSELLIVDSKASGESLLLIFKIWSLAFENVIRVHCLLECGIGELTADKGRTVEICREKSTAGEVTFDESAASQIAPIEDAILEVHTRKRLLLRR